MFKLYLLALALLSVLATTLPPSIGVQHFTGMNSYNHLEKAYMDCLVQNNCFNQTLMCQRMCKIKVGQDQSLMTEAKAEASQKALLLLI
mmetsp:Transcript_6708/g.10776  ORF Transcript_6708/g.10776 Transcript_6708/m.10776 type:complete len:89 (-) Transcript_6708:29-295(-)